MIQFLLLCLFLTCSLSANPNLNHTCKIYVDDSIENHIKEQWETIQEMKFTPDLHKILGVMIQIRNYVEYKTTIKIDMERHLETIFNEIDSHGIVMSNKDANNLRKMILKASKKRKIEHVPIKVQVGVVVSMCGLFYTFLPYSRKQQLNGEHIIDFGISLIEEGYKR